MNQGGYEHRPVLDRANPGRRTRSPPEDPKEAGRVSRNPVTAKIDEALDPRNLRARWTSLHAGGGPMSDEGEVVLTNGCPVPAQTLLVW